MLLKNNENMESLYKECKTGSTLGYVLMEVITVREKNESNSWIIPIDPEKCI